MKLNKHVVNEIIRKSPKPIGNFEICEALGLDPKKKKGNVRYYLSILEKEGLIEKAGKKYASSSLSDKIESVKSDLLQKLSESDEGYNINQLVRDFPDRPLLISVLMFLQGEGLIKGKPILHRYKEGIDDFNFFTLSPLGYSKVGKCPICHEPIDSSIAALSCLFRTSQNIHLENEKWKSVSIHIGCLINSGLFNDYGGKFEPGTLCALCGLPISPSLLPVRSVSYEDIHAYFYKIGLKPFLDFISELEKESRYVFESGSEAHPLEGKVISNFERVDITALYDKHSLKVPEWVSKGIENNSKEQPFSNKLIENFLLKDYDLSDVSGSGKFVEFIDKFNCGLPEGFEREALIIDVWDAALDVKRGYEEWVRKLYRELLGPAGVLYFNTEFGRGLEEFVKQGLDKKRELFFPQSVFSKTLVVKKKGKTYHPYCAQIIESMNQTHLDEEKLDGGEINGQKVGRR